MAAMTHLPGAWHIKTSRNKPQRETEYIILALQAEKTINKEKQKQKFSLHHIINVSMRACRRWQSGEMEKMTFKPMAKLQNIICHCCIFICAGCWHKHITGVWSDSSTKSTAYKQKEHTIAMVLVLHGFQLSKKWDLSEYILRYLF